MRKNIEKLVEMMRNNKIRAAEVNRQTGVDQGMLSKFKSGQRKIGTLTLNNAERLSNYYKELEMENMMEQIRKSLENTAEGYYIEEYASIDDLLEEREWTKEEYMEMVNEVNHEVIEDAPVLTYENPDSSLFNVVFVTDDMTAEDAIQRLDA